MVIKNKKNCDRTVFMFLTDNHSICTICTPHAISGEKESGKSWGNGETFGESEHDLFRLSMTRKTIGSISRLRANMFEGAAHLL